MAANNIILMENGIFPSKETNELVCMICPKTTTFVDWQKHVESLRHIGTLRSFKCTFKAHNSRLICDCGQEIEWMMLKEHATSHSIVPWYEPKSRYKKFFENHFQECDSSFNCHLCDTIFPEWSTAWVHTGEKTHMTLVEEALKMREDSKDFSSIETVYETLVTEGFMLWSATAVRCRVCNLADVRLRDIFTHIRTSEHSFALQKFIEILRDRIKKEFYDDQQVNSMTKTEFSDDRQVESMTKTGFSDDRQVESMTKTEFSESAIDIYVDKEKDNEYYCKLCKLKIIGRESVNVHAIGAYHTMTLKNYGCDKVKQRDSGVYWCEYCEALIGDMSEVCRHVMNKKHACAVSSKRDRSMIDAGTVEISKQSNVPSTTKNSDLSSNYITELIDGHFYCKICNTLLYDIGIVEIHVVSKLHKSCAKRYGCDNNIILTKHDKFQCLCCDYDISLLENISSHTLSNEHKNLAEKKNTREISQDMKNIEKNESTKIPEISFWYIEKLTDTKYYCYICLTSLPDRRAVQEHIDSEKHTFEFTRHCADAIVQKNDKFYCKKCNCELETRTFIIAHVKSAHTPDLTEKHNEKPLREVEKSDLILELKETSNEASENNKSEKSISNSLIPYGADIYITLKGHNRYWCECCACEIPTLENIFGHTSTNRHKYSAKSMNPNAPTLALTPNSACMYIVNLNGSEYHCKVCDLILSGQIAVNEHAVSEEHTAGMYRDGCHFITHTHDKVYHCKSCKCGIATLPNVYLHIKGTRHRESMLAPRRAQIKFRSESLNDVSSKSRDLEPMNINADEKLNSLSQYGGDKYITRMNAKEYWCASCRTVIPSLANIFGHTSSSRHQNSIIGLITNSIPRPDASSANLICLYIAKLGGSDYHCEVCNLMLSGNEMVNDHAVSEEHIASLKRYSCSSIVLKDGIDYYCNSCKCKIPGIANVYLHVRGPRHRDSSRNYISTNENAGRHDSPTNQRYPDQNTRSTAHAQQTRSSSLSRNIGDPYVEYIRGNKYYCRCCECVIPTFENIYVHITGTKHKNLARNSGDQLTAGPTLSCRYIVQLNNKNFFCKVCKISMYDLQTVEDHATGELHANARKRYGCDQIRPNIDNYSYYCRSCNCRIPNLANVYVHINGTRHIEGLPNAKHSGPTEVVSNGSTTKPEVAKVSGNGTKPEVAETSGNTMKPEVAGTSGNTTKPEVRTKSKNESDIVSLQTKRGENYIVSESITDFLCKICNIPIIGLANIDVHLASETHANARKEYGCDNITKSVMNKYNCRCCDCEVPNLENVHRHVKGHRHMMNVAKQRQISDNDIKIDNTESAKKIIEEKTNDKNKIGKDDENMNAKRKSIEKIEVNQHSLSSVNGAKSIEKFGNVKSLSPDISRADLSSRLGMTKKNSTGGRKLRTPKKPNTEKKLEFIDYDNPRIYELNDMWKDVEIGLQLCIPLRDSCVYCLICRETVDFSITNYFDHLRNSDHCKTLKEILDYHEIFESQSGFSDYGLALQYMEEIDENEIHCHVCRDFIENDEIVVEKHFLNEEHVQECREKKNEAKGIFEAMKLAKTCDWYNVHVYRCEPCGANFFTEFGLSRHLKFNGHTNFVDDKKMIYDHCSRCSILFYGTNDTYSKFHCPTPTHMWIFNCEESSPDLPKSAQIMLTNAANCIGNVLTGTSYENIEKETRKNEILIGDLEKIIKSEFPHAKAHIFGSRGCLVNTTDSDIDLFLDSGDMYEGNASANDQTEFIARVEKCLREKSRTWEILSLGTKSPMKFSVIKAHHRETGLYCNLSFDNGLCVESAKTIGMLCTYFPVCRKTVWFLKQWLELCNLKSPEGISTYALCWYVIFIMQQQEMIIPDIATIIERGGKSRKIAGWNVGTSSEFSRDFNTHFSDRTDEIVLHFFEYYADFDYRNKVVCPLIGRSLEKKNVFNLQELPNEMESYEVYMRNSNDAEPFRIDSPMCIQDPYNLQWNLTKDVKKSYLSRFRAFCAKSAILLRGLSSDASN